MHKPRNSWYASQISQLTGETARNGTEGGGRTVGLQPAALTLILTFASLLSRWPAAITQRVKTIGGRAWPNVTFPRYKVRLRIRTVVQQHTRDCCCFGGTPADNKTGEDNNYSRSAESLPVLDFRTLTDEQLSTAEDIFDDFRDRELMPAFLADADPNRALLDRRVVCDLLGFDEDTYQAVRRLSAKWCAEPSVHGGKRRPKGAGLVV